MAQNQGQGQQNQGQQSSNSSQQTGRIGSNQNQNQPITLLRLEGGRNIAILGKYEDVAHAEGGQDAIDLYRKDGWEIYSGQSSQGNSGNQGVQSTTAQQSGSNQGQQGRTAADVKPGDNSYGALQSENQTTPGRGSGTGSPMV